MVENNHFDYSPYAYVYNNPMLFIDPFGLDSLYVLDQGSRPEDDGTDENTYTALIYLVSGGEIIGSFRGSSYPNSNEAEGDNNTTYNTVNEGESEYNAQDGHNSQTEKGLNLVDNNGDRNTPGTDPNGNSINMTEVNAHEGYSNDGNYNSRGSQGCITF